MPLSLISAFPTSNRLIPFGVTILQFSKRTSLAL